MKTLVYDTETTGLPDWSKPSEDPCQPRVTQLCAELFEEDTGSVIASLAVLIKPDGWTIPEELQQLTGITMERATTLGVPMQIILPVFVEMWERADQRVAHNESFDMRMIRIELMRHPDFAELVRSEDGMPFPDVWKGGKACCTQRMSQSIINLPPTDRMLAAGRRGPKPPSLAEAYKHFMGTPLQNAHNASADAAACKAVYLHVRRSTAPAAAA